jgi:cell division protein FtsQ
MTARIARGGPSRAKARGQRKQQPKRTGRSKAKAPQQTMLESLGFSPGFARRLGNWLLGGMTVAVVIAAVIAFRLPQLAGIAMGEGIGQAGFTVRRIEPKGLARLDPMKVYEIVDSQRGIAMPLVDLRGVREQLMALGWVKEARVSRRLPDTLVVDIVEREPVAIWQSNQRLSLIDSDGVELERVRVEAMPDLLLLIGAGAQHRVAGLNGLLEQAPHLRPQITGATWVSGRRWDIRFQTGETLALPEGDAAARRALARFADMDRRSQMLGRGFVRFDMRDARRMVVRVTREPGGRVSDLTNPDPGPVPEDLARTI